MIKFWDLRILIASVLGTIVVVFNAMKDPNPHYELIVGLTLITIIGMSIGWAAQDKKKTGGLMEK